MLTSKSACFQKDNGVAKKGRRTMRLHRGLGLVAAIAALIVSCGATYAGVVTDSLNGGFTSGGADTGLSFFLNYTADPGSSPVSAELSGTLAFGDGASTNFQSNFDPNASYNQIFTHVYSNPAMSPALLKPSIAGVVDVFGANGSQIDSVDFATTGTVILFTGISAPTPAPITSGVPEPSTWAMMLIGFGGLGFFAYRRTRGSCASAALISA